MIFTLRNNTGDSLIIEPPVSFWLLLTNTTPARNLPCHG